MQVVWEHYEASRRKVERAFADVDGKTTVTVLLAPEEAMAIVKALRLAHAVRSISI